MKTSITRRAVLAMLAGGAAAPLLAQRTRELEVPYVPTPEELVEKMLDLAEVGESDYLIDLGCGDGRIPIAAGRRGARARGMPGYRGGFPSAARICSRRRSSRRA